MHGSRFLKWVGMPPVLKSDGWSVHNWKYENSRPLALVMPPGRGGSSRVIEQGAHFGEDGTRVTVSKEYVFTQRVREPGMIHICEVSFLDAVAIMTVAPWEFVDVTDMDRAEWPKVRNKPIIMPKSA